MIFPRQFWAKTIKNDFPGSREKENASIYLTI
jgi:hypothetical protein